MSKELEGAYGEGKQQEYSIGEFVYAPKFVSPEKQALKNCDEGKVPVIAKQILIVKNDRVALETFRFQ